MELIFASANANKIKELRALLPATYTLLGLEDAGITEEIPEPGATIRENSRLKALYVAERLKVQGRDLPVFADDSGLEVKALDNMPGVHSARYAGLPKSDQANNEKLLKALETQADRSARFITVITLIRGEDIHVFEGEVRGTITPAPQGSNGFGYDPVFRPDGYAETFAMLSPAQKNGISHRGRAVRLLLDFLTGSLPAAS